MKHQALLQGSIKVTKNQTHFNKWHSRPLHDSICTVSQSGNSIKTFKTRNTLTVKKHEEMMCFKYFLRIV